MCGCMPLSYSNPITAKSWSPVPEKNAELKQKLLELQSEHRDLDDVIKRLSQESYVDQLQLRRLKKRKLILKDRIEKLNSLLIPDLNA